MPISFIWDSSWESIPTDQIPRGNIRNVIGQIKLGTRERTEVEHEWGPNSEIDTGGHIPGGTGVAARGATVPITNLRDGELCVVDSGGDVQVWIRSAGAWVLIGTIDHNALVNRGTGDPHPIYLKIAGDDVTPNALKMGTKILRMSAAAGTPNRVFGNLLLLDHAYKQHIYGLGNIGAVAASAILSGKTKTYTDVATGTIYKTQRHIWSYAFAFFPEITVDADLPTDRIFFCNDLGGTFGIYYETGFTGSPGYQMRVRVAN